MSNLFAWLGNTDLRASQATSSEIEGPILNALKARSFAAVHLLSDQEKQQTESYVTWLQARFAGKITPHLFKLTSPTNYEEIFQAVTRTVAKVQSECDSEALTFHLSPGTPAMAAIWVLLAKTRYCATLIESSREQGVKTVQIPFELAAEFVPGANKSADDTLARLMLGMSPEAPTFAAIIHRCAAMKKAVAMARRLALCDWPILIQGESGTGKELFARAIHDTSERRGEIHSVNCGAIPQELVDSELFGHVKGAFTGATVTRSGFFESADGGTLFLDEIGELPLASQVRLLRVLQDGKVTKIGSTTPKSIHVRVIAATNRVLSEEVHFGRFREDLYHRLAVGVLLLPPLRQREGDLSLLIDSELARINAEVSAQPGYQQKRISASARNRLLQHTWPGNVRELGNTLARASIWASGGEITDQDVAEALAVTVSPKTETVLGQSFDRGISLSAILADVARHYLERAMTQAHGNKSEVAKMLDLGSYQTVSNWLQKYGLS